MSFLVDIFGYISVVLHGFAITGEAFTIGGIAFALLVAEPFRTQLGADGEIIVARSYRWLSWAALALALIEIINNGIQLAVLRDTAQLSWAQAMGASFAVSGAIKIAAALMIALLAAGMKSKARLALLALGLIVEIAAVSASHANARLEGRLPLMLYDLIHRGGASVWIGGLPYFLATLHGLGNGSGWRLVGRRYSVMSMMSVAAIALAGIGMAIPYIGSFQGLYGTAYGVMVMTKVVLFGGLLLLGLHNYKIIEKLRVDPMTPILRLKRSVEVEIGVGITIFFCAASITSLPPAADLTTDRVTAHEIVQRFTPVMPRLVSPSHGDLAIPALQAKLDSEAAAAKTSNVPEAFIPGSGDLPPRNAEDIAWSEYNHHWAGAMVLLIGFVALIEHLGVRQAKHWPLLFLVLAAFLLVRSDPEVWPMGSEGLIESLRDPEVVQHRMFVLVIILFGGFEWRVRAGKWGSSRAALVFPLITAVGAGLLLTHQHAISNVKDQMLIELSHTPIAILGVTAAWARWLEIRLDPGARRWPGLIWPICFMLVGLILLDYREA
jgi:putative copper resistance protein D